MVLKNLRMRFIDFALEDKKVKSFPRTLASSFKHINWPHSSGKPIHLEHNFSGSGIWCMHFIMWFWQIGVFSIFSMSKTHLKMFCAVTVIIKKINTAMKEMSQKPQIWGQQKNPEHLRVKDKRCTTYYPKDWEMTITVEKILALWVLYSSRKAYHGNNNLEPEARQRQY